MKKSRALAALTRSAAALLCCAVPSLPAGAEPDASARLLDGSTLCTYGDSLTALSDWPQEAALQLNMRLVNSGVGGNTTEAALQRFERDVASKEPDIVLIAFGTNDFVRENAKGSRLSPEQFRENLETIVEKVRALGADPVLMTCPYVRESVFTERYYRSDGGVLAVLDSYNEVTRQTAADLDVGLIDIRQACENYDASAFLSSDGVHLADVGNQVYTEEIVRYLTSVYRQDPNAPRVPQPTRPTAPEGVVTLDLISFDPNDWFTPTAGAMTFTQNEDGSLSIANTTGQWPDAHYSPESGVTVPIKGTRLEYDFSTSGAAASIGLFLNGSTPTLAKDGENISLNSYFEGIKLEASVGDIEKNQDVSGSILLSDLPIPADCIQDGTVLISGVKVFSVGAKNQPITLRTFRVVTDGSYVAPTVQADASETDAAPSVSVAPEGDKQLTPVLCIVSAGVLAAGLIAAGVVIVCRRKKRNRASSSDTDIPPGQA